MIRNKWLRNVFVGQITDKKIVQRILLKQTVGYKIYLCGILVLWSCKSRSVSPISDEGFILPSLFFNCEKGGKRPLASETPQDSLGKTRTHAHTHFTKVWPFSHA